MVVKKKYSLGKKKHSSHGNVATPVLLSNAMARLVVDEMQRGLDESALSVVARYVLLHKTLMDMDQLEALPEDIKSQWAEQVSAGCDLLKQWRRTITLNDSIEFLNHENAWYIVKVMSKPVSHAATIHFQGWDKKYDQKVCLLDEERVMPPHTNVAVRRVGKINTSIDSISTVADQQTKEVPVDVDSSAANVRTSSVMETVGAETDVADNAQNVFTRTTRTGRTISATIPPRTPRKTTATPKKEKVARDHNDWVCTVCGMLEAPMGTDLLMCDGPCRRSFHYECMCKSPDDVPDTWLCDQCTSGRHSCFVCGCEGLDLVEVSKCSLNTCGKYYHLECVQGDNLPFIAPTGITRPVVSIPESGALCQALLADSAYSSRLQEAKAVGGEAMRGVQTFSFRCPLHYCDTCFAYYGAVDTNDLNVCSYCPRAFHTNCVAPGCRFNSVCLVCPLHPELPIPGRALAPAVTTTAVATGTATKNVDQSEPMSPQRSKSQRKSTRGAGPEVDSDKGNNKRKKSSDNESARSADIDNYRVTTCIFFDQLTIPDFRPDPQQLMDTHFRLHKAIKDEIDNAPQNFTFITKNNYDSLPPEKLPPLEIPDFGCDCKDECRGETCLNYETRVECCEMRSAEKTPLCKVGAAHCSNRALQRKEYAKTQVFREGDMGLGLKSLEHIKKKQLVIEYMGEIIDETEMLRRLNSQRELTPNDKDYYIMELAPNLYVDGKFQGNVSRYINHSCEPNCELQRWNVRGRMRIGIVALRDISPGESLSYDYQFDTQEADVFKCYCGSTKCRGTMAPNKNNKEQLAKLLQANQLSREQRLKLIQAGMHKEKKGSDSNGVDEGALSYTGRCVPGDTKWEIKNGPMRNTFHFAQDRRIFLVRNVLRSCEFLKRQSGLHLKAMASSNKASSSCKSSAK